MTGIRSRLGALLLAAPLASACDNHTDDYRWVDGRPGGEPPEIYVLTIDPDEFIEADAGLGAGMYVEYESDGRWWVSTTCDTDLSGYECAWDVVISVDPGQILTLVSDVELEADDRVIRLDEGALRLIAYTDFDFDSIAFETSAGAPVQFDTLLDGSSQPRFFNWIGDGGLQQGAPSNPLELTPAR